MGHHVVHIELSANDLKAAAKFYGAVFGWEHDDFPEMSYTTFKTGEGVGGGYNPVTADNPAGRVTVYISTDDVEASLAKVEANGGKTIFPPMPVPTVGVIAMFTDPTGNIIGLLKPDPAGMGG